MEWTFAADGCCAAGCWRCQNLIPTVPIPVPSAPRGSWPPHPSILEKHPETRLSSPSCLPCLTLPTYSCYHSSSSSLPLLLLLLQSSLACLRRRPTRQLPCPAAPKHASGYLLLFPRFPFRARRRLPCIWPLFHQTHPPTYAPLLLTRNEVASPTLSAP